MSRTRLAARAATVAAVALVVGCTTEQAPPTVATTGVSSAVAERARAFRGDGADTVGARLFGPTRGPVELADWRELPAPSAPVPVVVYLPSCSTPAAPRDHIPYLQGLGVAVAVPALRGLGCVDPDEPFDPLRLEIEVLAGELAAVPWIDDDRMYLMGHSVGADLATSFGRPDVFDGVIGLAAACTFGVNERIPTLTFRALDDPVLAIRQTRCTALDEQPNALHLEFAGSDHVLRLSGEGNGSRRLVGRAIAQFIGVAGAAPGPSIADADARDMQQLSGPVAAPADEGAPSAAAVVRDTPAFDPRLVPDDAAPSSPAAEAPTPASSDGMLYVPSLNLSPGQL